MKLNVTAFQSISTLYHTMPTFNDLEERSLFKTSWEKGENAGNHYFLLFPQFSTLPTTHFNFFGHIYFVVCECFQF